MFAFKLKYELCQYFYFLFECRGKLLAQSVRNQMSEVKKKVDANNQYTMYHLSIIDYKLHNS